jgi:hypothetical protein
MDAAQIYAMDVEGYLVVRGACTAAELAAAGGGGAAAALLLEGHPTISQYVNHVMGTGVLNIPARGGSGTAGANAFQLDQGPTPLTGTADGLPDFSHCAAWQVDGARLCYGVTAVVALADCATPAAGVTVVPSSHNSTLAPPDLRADDMGVLMQVPLAAGDVLLAASTLMISTHGNPQGLLKVEFTPLGAFPSAGIPPFEAQSTREPAWLEELSEEQKAVVSARTVGMQSSSSSSNPNPIVMSDGERTWVEPRPAFDTPRGNPGLQPPSIFARTETSLVSARDLWFFGPSGHTLSSARQLEHSIVSMACTVRTQLIRTSAPQTRVATW